jgi:hypothetical protein
MTRSIRSLLLHVLLGLGLGTLGCDAFGQRDSSLTPEFAKLSAKQRARIAAQEVEDAQRDTAFQHRMEQAEAFFQAQRYEEALDRYREARNMRPYNVHPKVKIQDLEALIARRAQEVPTTSVPQPPPPTAARPATHAPPRPAAPIKEPVAPAPRIIAPRPAASDPPPLREPSVRTFKEGRAIVQERIVEEEGRSVVWRKVAHPWGEVVYFKDGKAVSARQWSERFSP